MTPNPLADGLRHQHKSLDADKLLSVGSKCECDLYRHCVANRRRDGPVAEASDQYHKSALSFEESRGFTQQSEFQGPILILTKQTKLDEYLTLLSREKLGIKRTGGVVVSR